MSRMNFLGGNGYLTDRERKMPLEHTCNFLNFNSNIELSKPIVVTLLGTMATGVTVDEYSNALAAFICWWTRNVLPDLNGVSRFHHDKFITQGFKVVPNENN